MGKVVEKKKKKKGRPSLLDLEKRNLREQQQQQQQQQPQQKRNPNSNPYSNSNYRNPIVPGPNPNPNRRLTRRNPYPEGIPAADSEGGVAEDEDDDEDEDSNGKRKEKKLKFVLRIPSNQQPRSSLNTSLNSGSYGSDSNAEDDNSGTPHKKRKINAVRDGSGPGDDQIQKGDNPKSASKGKESGSPMESGPTTPLPDKQLLLFILDRLQKKDTYGVFSEPVNPDELQDYHEVIQDPMDFGTVRKKVTGGAYANLEQFEKDVFLICSNAMTYNAPDTIYYRQARSIQELAHKNFENLRQDSEDNEPQPQPKVVRRGRPPTKHLKKPLGRPPSERAGSEFSSDATPGDNSNLQNSYDQRKGFLLDMTGNSDASGRTFHGSHSSEAYTSWFAERKYEKNDEFPGSGLKGMPVKYWKKQCVSDESRRNTYNQFHPSAVGCKPSVFTVFDGEPKQLLTVGLQAEFGYARSLARFAANLGPVAWKIASQKIERALPAGLKFGPGWVVDNDVPLPQVQAPSQPVQLLPQPSSLPKILASTATIHAVEPGDKTSEKDSSNNPTSDGIHSKRLPPSSAASSTVPIRTPEPTTIAGAAGGLNGDSGLGLLNSSGGGGAVRPRPPFQIHQSPLIQNTMNGFAGGTGFNVSPQMGKMLRTSRPATTFGSEATMASGIHAMVARSSNFTHPIPGGHSESEGHKLSASSNKINSAAVLPDSSQESQLVPGVVHRKPSWGGLSLHQKTDSVPPDLNVRFQSPGSPSSSVPVDSPQPDLALQL